MNSRGMTLVEIMVSLVLGSVLCLGAATLLAKSKRAYLQDEQVLRTHENGHYALRLLSRELSMAGYFGEALLADTAPAPAVGTDCYRYLVQVEAALEHFDNLGSAGNSKTGRGIPEGCARPGDHLSGADALLLRRAADRPVVHWGQALAATSGDVLYLRIERPGAKLKRGVEGLGEEDSLWRYQPQLFFLRRYSRYRGDGIPALCRIRLSPEGARTAPVECLVEGVEQMQFEFGIDTDGDQKADRYLSAPTAAELSRALVVRIQLLLRSPLPLPGHSDRNNYSLGNSPAVRPADGFYRRVLSQPVLLRNSDVLRS